MTEPSMITSVGLATAQGSAKTITTATTTAPPAALPWPELATSCPWSRPAAGIAPELTGAARWSALARAALTECLEHDPADRDTPLVIGSCNGAAHTLDREEWQNAFATETLLRDTPWAGTHPAVASGSCASGLHALFAAQTLIEGGASEVIVLAVEILSRASHGNFDSLRVLSPSLDAPWQATTRGFVPGEAAVALRLTRASAARPGKPGIRLAGPALDLDANEHDGLATLLGRSTTPGLILGQGTGPADADTAELAAARTLDAGGTIPMATPAYHFGHTLGASGLLAVALAALDTPLAALTMPAPRARDGRPLARHGQTTTNALIQCRALGGACAVAATGHVSMDRAKPHGAAPHTPRWAAPMAAPALHSPLLRRIADEAPRFRPRRPPACLVVRLDAPLVPDPRARAGQRLLPSAILEITPGFIPLLIARLWGFRGPALCWVGGEPDARDLCADLPLFANAASLARGICVVYVETQGANPRVHWSANIAAL